MSDTAPAVEPLTIDELAELEEYLLSELTPDACMDISTLDGFLTCILSCPQRPVPEEWINRVWDTDEAEEEPEFESQEQGDRIFALIARHAAALDHALQNETADYEPLFFYEDEDGQVPAVEEWCIGYIIAANEYRFQWEPLMDAKPELFDSIRLFGSPEGQEELEDKLDDMDDAQAAEFMQQQAINLREAALAVYRLNRSATV